MRNPLDSEEMAFRYVLGALVYFGAIVAASSIATWLGLVVFVAASAVAVYLIHGGGQDAPPAPEEANAAVAEVADTHRVVVLLAGAPVVGPRLRRTLVALAADVPEDVLLVSPVPALADEGGNEMREHLERVAEALGAAGVRARAEITTGDPLAALLDVLARAPADEVVVSVPDANADCDRLVAAVRARFSGPVTVVVEAEG